MSDAGTVINTMRALIIPAVLGDATLNDLTYRRRGIRYAGLQSTMHLARWQLGSTALVFRLAYVLVPGAASDVREAILARLQTVAGGIAGVVTSERNRVEADDSQLPLVSVLEGDEEVNGDERVEFTRESMGSTIVVMTPQVLIRAAG